MKVIKHQVPAPPPPPPTYDLVGLTQSEMEALLEVTRHCTQLADFLRKNYGLQRAGLSLDLNRIYHALVKTDEV